jgi:hypothetical protein
MVKCEFCEKSEAEYECVECKRKFCHDCCENLDMGCNLVCSECTVIAHVKNIEE